MFLFSRFFRFDVYTYAGHRKKTASSSYCDSPLIFIRLKKFFCRDIMKKITAGGERREPSE